MDNNALAYNYEDERPYEIINGEVRMMSAPNVNHTRINSTIDRIFDRYLEGKTCEPFNQTNVYLSDKDHLIPDEIIVCNPDIVEENGIRGIPDLVVEILSKSTKNIDRNEKFYKYEKYGVKEYWIVDPFMKCVEVYQLKDGKFVKTCDAQYYSDSEIEFMNEKEKAAIIYEIKVSLYDDFVVKVKDIFSRVK